MATRACDRAPISLALAIAAALAFASGCGSGADQASAPTSEAGRSVSSQAAGPSDRIDLGRAGSSLSWLGNDRILFYDESGLVAVDIQTRKRETIVPASGDSSNESLAAVSPDGKRIAFTHRLAPGALPVLQVLTLGESEARTVAPPPKGPYGYYDPVWSPDGKMLASYDRDRGMQYIIAADGGGEPRALPLDFPGYEFADVRDWSADRLLVSAGSGSAAGLFAVPVGGGSPTRLDGEGRPQPGSASWPVGFSPDGTKVAYARPDGGLWLAASDGSWRRQVNAEIGPLNRGRLRASFAPDGRLAFAVDEGLWLAEPDGREAARLTTSGCQIPTVSPDGSKVACYYAEEHASGAHSAWVSIVAVKAG